MAVMIAQLVEAFAENVAAQTDAIWRGDAKTGNKHANRYIAAFQKLRAHGDPGREALAQLFAHPRMDVRTAAATYLLRYKTEEAKSVLQEVARGEGLVPFTAQEALKRWDEGAWSLDPE